VLRSMRECGVGCSRAWCSGVFGNLGMYGVNCLGISTFMKSLLSEYEVYTVGSRGKWVCLGVRCLEVDVCRVRCLGVSEMYKVCS
jgi:hypothetical protein